MRIVVTGASGNVGTALLRQLAESGNGHEVIGVVRRPPERTGVYGSVTWRGLDIADADARDRLRRIFDGADAVVHLAWGFQPTRNTRYLTSVGVGGTSAVVDAAHDAAVGQVVHMSSVGTYAAGRYGQRVDESWPATGIATSPYSRDKSAAEALLDAYESAHGSAAIPIARMRPGFILQKIAASGLMRYALPGYVPMRVVPLVPLLPLDRRLCIPVVHADDVAGAFVRVIERRARGPFNVAAEPPVSRDDVGEVLGAKPIHVPSAVLGGLADVAWRLRLQPVDRGWLDMAFSVPLLDCGRARAELDWSPTWSSTEALADVITGIGEHAHYGSPPLRRRSLLDRLRRDFTAGPITTRQRP
ncbi:NAD-dependent epimerase/dehydratase family protein [Mycobacterium sp. URHB0044]|jgi:UDP-glucose 4-epimerase|uniref:NAD-dependent epimerase/dehydratase family protein n=1 Tax=Mycobacterium sp. URHB0044 TaxID=1380386 RepID=UPI00048EF8C2|nr:NAD-dependent epimerase/dehydratase family protein [Mycobacterium sp. URHB0044]